MNFFYAFDASDAFKLDQKKKRRWQYICASFVLNYAKAEEEEEKKTCFAFCSGNGERVVKKFLLLKAATKQRKKPRIDKRKERVKDRERQKERKT